MQVTEADVTFTNHLLLEEHALIRAVDANVAPGTPNVSLAEASETYGANVMPLVEDIGLDVLWLGLRVRGAGEERGATRTSEVQLTPTALEGPGELTLYLTQALGQPEVYWDSVDGFDDDDVTTLPPEAHTHLNWAFSAPGEYRLTLASALDNGDGAVEPLGQSTFAFAVGIDPNGVDPGGDGAPIVLDDGHSDVTVDLDTGKLYMYGDPDGGMVQQELPADQVVIDVPNRALETVPEEEAFAFLGEPGAQIHQLPQAVLGKHVHHPAVPAEPDGDRRRPAAGARRPGDLAARVRRVGLRPLATGAGGAGVTGVWEFLAAPWDQVFMQRAFAVALCSGIVCGVIGSYVVLRGMAFIGDAIAHSVFPGVAVAFVLQANLVLGGAVAGLGTAVAVAVLSQSRRLKEDTVIGVLFAAAFGLGLVILSTAPGYSGSLESFLFGSILGISDADVRNVAVLGVLLLAAAAVLHPRLVTVALERKTARASGRPVLWLDMALYVMVTIAIVTSLQAVGDILVLALLVTPAACARLLTDSLGRMMLLAPAIGAGSCVAGLYLSYGLNLAAGGLIVSVATAAFLACWLLAPRHGFLARRRQRTAGGEVEQATKEGLGTSAPAGPLRPATREDRTEYPRSYLKMIIDQK